MNRKNRNMGLLVLLSLVTLFFFITMSAVTAEEEQEVPDEISIDNKGYKTDRKGPVTLSHADHAENYDAACTECHHDYKDGKNIWEEGDFVKKCVECHSPLKSEGKTKKLNIAYHNNCKGCHKKLAKQEGGTEAPYKKCSDCHEKKS
ncbi:cytochrome c3 family protein [Thermodesulfobacteriota bacterium]